MDASLDKLDSEALHAQRRFRRATVAAQIAGIAAGFIALLPDRAAIVGAALLLLAATVVTFISDQLRWESKWHAKRDLVEYLHGIKYKYRMRVAPYSDEQSALSILQDHLVRVGQSTEIDPSWKATRALPSPQRMAWYQSKRVDPQLSFYKSRTDRFQKRAANSKFMVYLLYIIVVITTVLQAFGAWQAELVGPIVAVIAGIQTWVAAGRWDRTAQIYEQTSDVLQNASRALDTYSTRVDEAALVSLVSRIEDTLANESQRWLALNNFEISETVSYRMH